MLSVLLPRYHFELVLNTRYLVLTVSVFQDLTFQAPAEAGNRVGWGGKITTTIQTDETQAVSQVEMP